MAFLSITSYWYLPFARVEMQAHQPTEKFTQQQGREKYFTQKIHVKSGFLEIIPRISFMAVIFLQPRNYPCMSKIITFTYSSHFNMYRYCFFMEKGHVVVNFCEHSIVILWIISIRSFIYRVFIKYSFFP